MKMLEAGSGVALLGHEEKTPHFDAILPGGLVSSQGNVLGPWSL